MNCVLCDSSENLNTNISISINDDKYDVLICDNCEDDATPKNIKNSLMKKIEIIDDIKSKANELGYVMIKVEEYQKLLDRVNKVDTQTTQDVNTSSTTSKDVEIISSDLPASEQIRIARSRSKTSKKLQSITAESGRVIALPEEEKDASGKTRIRYNKFTDKDLQNRAKNVNANMQNDTDLYKYGYKDVDVEE